VILLCIVSDSGPLILSFFCDVIPVIIIILDGFRFSRSRLALSIVSLLVCFAVVLLVIVFLFIDSVEVVWSELFQGLWHFLDVVYFTLFLGQADAECNDLQIG